MGGGNNTVGFVDRSRLHQGGTSGGSTRKPVMLNQKGGNVYRGNAGNVDRMNNNHAFNVVELSKKVDRLTSALDRQISKSEANVAVLKPVQGGGGE